MKSGAQMLEERALRAVAKQFPATRAGVRSQSIALEVAQLLPALSSTRRGAQRSARPRLREDRVAQRVLRDLESKLNPLLTGGRTIILTLGAPIRVASRLVTALADTLATYLASGAEDVDVGRQMLGNRVRFRVINAGSRWTPQLIGFVFSGDPRPGLLAGTLVALHEAIARSHVRRVSATGARRRWLVLLAENFIADGKTYQRALSKIAPSHGYDRILMVTADGRVELLADAGRHLQATGLARPLLMKPKKNQVGSR